MKNIFKHISKYTDEELMVQLMNHHSHAPLLALHQRYGKRLLGYFYKMLNKDQDKAQDFVQDIFLKIIEKKHLFDPSKKFYTWIFTIAGNMCKTEFRKPQNVSLSNDEYEISAHCSQENLAEKENFHVLLEKSLNTLENHHRETFVLRFMEQFSLLEIAEITNVSLGTVKSRLFYATQKMTSELKDYNPKFEGEFFK